MSGILIDVNTNAAKSEKDLAKLNEAIKNIEKTTQDASKSISNAFSLLSKTFLSGGLLFGLKAVSDEFTEIENKVALITGRTFELVAAQERLFKIAQSTRSSYAQSANLFSSFGKSLKDANVSTEKIFKATEAVQKSLAVSGSNAQSAAGALLQLGQGLSSGTLRGEELNSVLEGAPRLAKAISDELGVTTGNMRLLAQEGKLTSAFVLEAILNQSKKINSEFELLRPTLSQASTVFGDSVKRFVSEFEKGLGISGKLAGFLTSISNSINKASENAFELGINLAISFSKAKIEITRILKPIFQIFTELGKQALKIFPEGFLTRTLTGDINAFIRYFDDTFLGGLISSAKKFSFTEIFSIRSDVEKAISQLRKLSPSYWAASGFDTQSIQKFLSVENIRLYGSALSQLAAAVSKNTTDILSDIYEFSTDVNFALKRVATYFGISKDFIVTFKIGQAETLFLTLNEIQRGVLKVSRKIWELNKLIVDLFKSNFQNFIETFLDFLTSLFISTYASLEEYTRAVFIKIQTIIENSIKQVSNIFENLIEEINRKTNFSNVVSKIKEFGTNVIDVFKNIYDKVIGNSWWTDTIASVIDSGLSLWDKVSSGFNNFKNNVEKTFKDIYEKSKDIFAELPNAVKTALVLAGAAVATFLLPGGAIKTLLTSALITNLVVTSARLGELFTENFANESLALKFGEKLGQGFAYFLKILLSELPEFLSILGGFISGFFKGLVSQLPALGSLFSGLFSIFSSLGIAGPVGLIGAYLFGKNLGIFKLISKLGPIKQLIEFFDIAQDSDTGKKKSKKKAGILATINETIGTSRTVALAGLAAISTGAVDSLFAGSALAEYIATGGLLYTAIFGKEGVNNIIDTVGSKVLKPISSLLKNFLIKNNKVELVDLLFGKSGTAKDKVTTYLTPIIDAIKSKITKLASSAIDTSFDFLKTLLLGDNPTRTKRKLQVAFARAIQEISADFSKISAPILDPIRQKIDDLRYQRWLRKNANPAEATAGINAATQAFTAAAASAAATAAATGGPTGLLGKLFLGKIPLKKTLIGLSLALGSALAFAGETATNIDTPLDKFKDSLSQTQEDITKAVSRGFSFEALGTKFNASISDFLMLAIPTVLGAFLLLKNKISSVATEIKALGQAAAASSIGGVISGRTPLSRRASPLVMGGAIVGSGVIAGSIANDPSVGIAVATLIASVFSMLPRKILAYFSTAAIRTALVAGVKLLLSPAVLVGTAVVSTLGAAYIWLFGESGEFFKDLSTAINKVKEFFGLKPEEKSKRGLSKEDEAFVKSRKLSNEFNLENINLSKLDSEQKEKLIEKQKQYTDALQRAREEEDLAGKIPEDLQNLIKDLDRSLVQYTTKLAARPPEMSDVDFIKQMTIIEPKRRISQFTIALDQFSRDVLYAGTELQLKLRRRLAKDNAEKLARTLDLEKLKEEKSTFWNAYFRPLKEVEQNLLDLAKRTENVLMTDAEIEAELSKARKKFEEVAPQVRAKEVGFGFGFNKGFQPLPSNDPLKGRYIESVLEYTRLLQEKLNFEIAQRQIKAFSSDLNAFEAKLKAGKIDLTDIFATSNFEFEKLKELSTVLEDLGKQVLLTKDITERNEIIIRIKEVRRQISDIFQRSQETISENKPQVVLSELSKQMGYVRPENFYEKFSDEAAKALIKDLQDLRTRQQESKLRPIEPMFTPLPGTPKKATSAFKNAMEELNAPFQTAVDRPSLLIGPSLAEANRLIDQSVKNILKSESDLAKGTQAELELAKLNAEKAGISFEQLLSKYNVSQAIKATENLNNLLDQLTIAKRDRNDNRIVSLTAQIENFKEELNRPIVDFPAVLSQVASAGYTITPEDIINTPGILKNLTLVANSFIETEVKIKNLKTSFTEANLGEILSAKLKRAELAFKSFLQTVGNTPNKLFDIFSKFGLNESNQISSLSDSVAQSILNLERIKLTLEDIGKTKTTNSDFKVLTLLKDKIDLVSNALKNNLSKTFGTEFNRINSILEAGLTETQFANLPRQLTDTLSIYANFLDQNLENIRKKGKTIAGEAPKEFFSKFNDAIQNIKVLKFVSDFATTAANLATEGLKSQFDKFSESLGETVFNKKWFASLGKVNRQQLTEQALALRSIESALDLPNLTDEQVNILKKVIETPENAKNIFKEFSENVMNNLSKLDPEIKAQQEKFLKEQVSPIDRNINALGINSDRLREVVSALSELTTSIDNIINNRPTVVKPSLVSNIPESKTLEQSLIDDGILDPTRRSQIIKNLRGRKPFTETINKNISKDLPNEVVIKLPTEELSQNISDVIITPLDKSLSPIIEKLEKPLLNLTKVPTTLPLKISQQDSFLEIIDSVENALTVLQRSAIQALTGIPKILARSKILNLDFDELKFKALSPNAQKEFERLLDKAYSDQQETLKTKTPELIKNASKSLEDVKDFIEEQFPEYTNTVKQASIDFVNSVTSDFREGLSDFIKGRAVDGKSPFKTFTSRILDNTTGKIVDLFVGSFVDSIAGKNSIIFKKIKEFGSNIFEFGQNFLTNFKTSSETNTAIDPLAGLVDSREQPSTSVFQDVFGKITSIFTTTTGILTGISGATASTPVTIITTTSQIIAAIAAAANAIVTAISFSSAGAGGLGALGSLGGLGPLFSGGFGGITALLGNMGGGAGWAQLLASGLIPVATGGRVVGPGSATSDSIPALLSNGEFVVNAKQSAKHLALLSAINNGEVRKFAMGGMAGSSPFNTSSNNSRSSSQQVFNINVTGDVSRQTRREIVSMMPQIANGVNFQNRENNVSRRTET